MKIINGEIYHCINHVGTKFEKIVQIWQKEGDDRFFTTKCLTYTGVQEYDNHPIYNSWLSPELDWEIRLATEEERAWLTKCIRADKFVEKTILQYQIY